MTQYSPGGQWEGKEFCTGGLQEKEFCTGGLQEKEVSSSIVITVETDRTGFEDFEDFVGSPFTFGENICWSKDRTELDGDLLLKRFQNSPDFICDDIEEEVDLIEA